MKNTTDGVPIAVVEQETGLSKDVLRKWEARYRYPAPDRNEHGDRVYGREQVARLRTIKRLLDGGYRPAKLLAMSEAELAGLAAAPPPGSQASSETTVSPLDKHMKSGLMPACSQANKVPVRPKPTAISSAIKCTPYLSQASRSRFKYTG